MKIAFIGAGNMASAMIGGLIAQGAAPRHIVAVDPDAEKLNACARRFNVCVSVSPGPETADVDAIVLSVKPQILKAVCASLSPWLDRQLVISVAAGAFVDDISRWAGGYTRIVRAMPNTPALIRKGVTGLYASFGVDDGGRALATAILGAVGSAIWFEEEEQLDAVTAISGSGPAYVFYFMEALQDAGVRAGLSVDQSRMLVVQTFVGATQLAEQSGEPPGVLRERVTSQGGTTAAAVSSFDASRMKDEIVRGALCAKSRAAEIGRELGSNDAVAK
ncbi:pyrroline-5-carboxylate reductase [Burkholderia multivorans]|uniref:pyrroline-5-carboxylate reductase n=1 Tax=Burkholderia multivorans TaxID=87883 RepID=UPI00075E4695|nr:pyrroline-5-carboxylate reductase [Burkholderia multivorans]KWF64727.1 pyrroline-5-carboxylate reductase [Burkholderia multivorans]KWF82088.1 pyrroline-5-carboxylate reductase [Burkholderia multivorans]